MNIPINNDVFYSHCIALLTSTSIRYDMLRSKSLHCSPKPPLSSSFEQPAQKWRYILQPGILLSQNSLTGMHCERYFCFNSGIKWGIFLFRLRSNFVRNMDRTFHSQTMKKGVLVLCECSRGIPHGPD